MRVARGNRAVHLDGDIVPLTLLDRAVSEEADIRERKLLFHNWGHDHTGGVSGAVITDTYNYISNSLFQHNINASGTAGSRWRRYDDSTHQDIPASGAPDFWNASGNIQVNVSGVGYIGQYACHLTSQYDPLPSYPMGTQSFYQDIPSPSGMRDITPPSGTDWARIGASGMTLGCWASGNGTFYMGHHDTIDRWGALHSPSLTWEWFTYPFNVDPNADHLRVLFCPGEDDSVAIDNVQLVIGSRIISTNPKPNEKDRDSWRRHNNIYTNAWSSGINRGDVVVVSPGTYGGVIPPWSKGEGKVQGVAVDFAPSSGWIPVCNLGQTLVNVHGPVNYGASLITSGDPLYRGYAISLDYVSLAEGSIGSTVSTFATALDEKQGVEPGEVLALVYPSSASTAGSTVTKGVIYNWDFKMVDSSNFATPETGLTVSVTISQDGSAFNNLNGSPAVTEIGFGWYTIAVAAVDMNYTRVVLRAIATGAAQHDRSIALG